MFFKDTIEDPADLTNAHYRATGECTCMVHNSSCITTNNATAAKDGEHPRTNRHNNMRIYTKQQHRNSTHINNRRLYTNQQQYYLQIATTEDGTPCNTE